MLAKMLPKFAGRGLFNISKFQCVSNEEEELIKELKKKFEEKDAKYHKTCYTSYDQFHFDHIASPLSKEKDGPSSSKRTKRESIELGELRCFIWRGARH